MNMLRQLNAAIEYIEANLCAEFDPDTAAGIACISADSFARFFSYLTGMTLTEYVRRRRLTLAAQELRHSRTPVVDIAVKYGYDSAAAFSRAFVRQHGISPSAYRKNGGSIRVYSPASFHIMIKGAREMDLRMIELEETKVFGVSKPYDGQGYKSREELRHIMWSEDCDDIPGQLCEGRWNEPGNTAYDGVWYGVWQNGRYMIARRRADVRVEQTMETYSLPAGTYAAFKTECGGLAWEEFPRLFEQIFESWLPASEYRQKYGLAVEVFHLWTDHDLRKKNRYFEVWIPVELKGE
ncbi:MAG: AraC family transcriptional regulator [Clostridia bacterium]|nr:AraC family transcriptional regulator [Clostridia bacterium]